MTAYQATLDFLFSQLPQYQKLGSKAYKADLSNIIELCSLLGNPQNHIKTVHVAGSNGKGSTSHMIASILQEAGYKVGLYTSPHLKDFRERIKINGNEIPKNTVVEFVDAHKRIFDAISPSFFEWTVALAFYYFSQENTDINVIETGLGGRLDSTNILRPEVSVITNISLEHTQILGDTIEEIANEKAGIIKSNTPIVIGKTQAKTSNLFQEIAKRMNAPIYFSDQLIKEGYLLDLRGDIQQENAKTASQTVEVLNNLTYHISPLNLREGLANTIKNTKLLGRFQVVETNPSLVLDTAHNPNGIHLLVKEIANQTYSCLHVVIGIAKDKKHQEMLSQFPQNSTFYFCSSINERVMSGQKLKDIGQELGLRGDYFSSVKEGIQAAKKTANKKDLIIVTGSNFIVADAL